MESYFLEAGLLGLFLLGFAAATVLPLGSEWLLVLLISQGTPVAEAVMAATVGNYLGSCTTWGIGLLGSQALVSRLLRISPEQAARARQFYQTWGVWTLLLAWLPIIGDPLCLVAGVLRTRFWLFSLLVFSGKLARYLLLALVSTAALG